MSLIHCVQQLRKHFPLAHSGDTFIKYLIFNQEMVKHKLSPLFKNQVYIYNTNQLSWSEEQELISSFPGQIFLSPSEMYIV